MIDTFDYHLSSLVNDLINGSHKSRQRGTGADFHKKSLFLAEPDLSAIDIKSSVTDPFEQLYIRSYRQRSKINVMALIDSSSSMRYGNKPALSEQFYLSCKASVNANNDNFHGYLFSDQIVHFEQSEKVAEKITQTDRNVAQSFDDIVKILPQKPSLIFLASDFHWQQHKLSTLLAKLSNHIVVPVIIWQKSEYENYPLWRFIEVIDLETHSPRLVFSTPKQKQHIIDGYQRHKAQLQQVLLAHHCRPFWLIDDYSASKMSQYFLA